MNIAAISQGVDSQVTNVSLVGFQFAGALVEFRFDTPLERLGRGGWENLSQVLADLCLRDGHALLCRQHLVLGDGRADFRLSLESPSAVLGAGFGWRRPSSKKRPFDWHEFALAVEPIPAGAPDALVIARLAVQHRVGLGRSVATHKREEDHQILAGEVKCLPWDLNGTQYALFLHARYCANADHLASAA